MKTVSSLGSVALIAALVSAPSAALAVSDTGGARPTETIAACEVADATLSWGTLERWRSYIQGSIAQGGWTVDGDVTYEMPEFVWTGGSGVTAVDGTAGTVNFDGEVRFAGHDDLLRVNAAQPTLELVDAQEAYLLLDLSSTNPDGTEDTNATQVRAVKLDIAGTVTGGGASITFADVAGDLTAEGAAAFGGFYAAGEAVDPLTIELTAASGCEFVPATTDGGASDGGSASTPENDTPVGDADANTDADTDTDADVDAAAEAADDASEFPWTPVIIGGVALVVIVGAGAMLIAGRKRSQTPGSGE